MGRCVKGFLWVFHNFLGIALAKGTRKRGLFWKRNSPALRGLAVCPPRTPSRCYGVVWENGRLARGGAPAFALLVWDSGSNRMRCDWTRTWGEREFLDEDHFPDHFPAANKLGLAVPRAGSSQADVTEFSS